MLTLKTIVPRRTTHLDNTGEYIPFLLPGGEIKQDTVDQWRNFKTFLLTQLTVKPKLSIFSDKYSHYVLTGFRA